MSAPCYSPVPGPETRDGHGPMGHKKSRSQPVRRLRRAAEGSARSRFAVSADVRGRCWVSSRFGYFHV